MIQYKGSMIQFLLKKGKDSIIFGSLSFKKKLLLNLTLAINFFSILCV